MLLHELSMLIVFYRIPASAASILSEPYLPTALQIPQSVTPDLYRMTLLVNKAQLLLKAFGSKEAEYSSLSSYYSLMIETQLYSIRF